MEDFCQPSMEEIDDTAASRLKRSRKKLKELSKQQKIFAKKISDLKLRADIAEDGGAKKAQEQKKKIERLEQELAFFKKHYGPNAYTEWELERRTAQMAVKEAAQMAREEAEREAQVELELNNAYTEWELERKVQQAAQMAREEAERDAQEELELKEKQCQDRIWFMRGELDATKKHMCVAIEAAMNQEAMLRAELLKEKEASKQEVFNVQRELAVVQDKLQTRLQLEVSIQHEKEAKQQEVLNLQCQLAAIQEELANLKRLDTCNNKVKLKPHACLPPEPMWQFEIDYGVWESFLPSFNAQVSNAYVCKKSHCQFAVANMEYSVDFDAMTQTNLKTRRQRRIQCTFCIPSHWYSTDADMMEKLRNYSAAVTFESIVRPVDHKRHQQLNALLQTSVFHHGACQAGACKANFSLKQAFQVENLPLHSDYLKNAMRLRETLVEAHAPKLDQTLLGPLISLAEDIKCDPCINEVLLFHGCSMDAARQIAVSGFDFRMAAQNGYYGRGTYFASQSCKAAQYSERKASDRNGLFTMIVSRVAIGDPYFIDRVDKELGRPPTSHHSVIARPGPMRGHCNGEQTHCEFIVYERMQAYPEYILQFERS